MLLSFTPGINSSPAPFAKAIIDFNQSALGSRDLFNIWKFEIIKPCLGKGCKVIEDVGGESVCVFFVWHGHY